MKLSVSRAGKNNKVTVIKLGGRIDTLVADEILSTLREVINQGGHHLLINMTDVTFINSSGLRILLSTAKKIHDVEGKLVLTNLTPRVREVFTLSDLEDLFVFYDTEESALAEDSNITI